MWPVLSQLFVRSFYRANTGFFLFFFFLFFGAVEGSSLLSYHLSLVKSMLTSSRVLCLVLFCWTLYHLKCTAYFLRIINSAEGRFLANLQALPKSTQWALYGALYTAVYAPVLVYATVVFFVGLNKGYAANASLLLCYQILSMAAFTTVLFYRLNHWPERPKLFSFRLSFQKTYLLLALYHFVTGRKNLLLVLKGFSLCLLYVVLVWNTGRYDNDAFLYFYLVLYLAHAAVPYFAVRFFEHDFAVCRNLPVPLTKRAAAFFIPYLLLVLPEAVYLFYHGAGISLSAKLAYLLNLPACLFLLTAVQYSEAQSREEYLKAVFALAFVMLFAFHAQAFWFWIGVQLVVAATLFATGYYSFERKDE